MVAPHWLGQETNAAVVAAEAADRLGFSEYWIGELSSHDALSLAGAIARETSSITLTVGPLPVGVRDSAALAMGVASVSALSGRPARLALGASTPTVVSRWHRRPWRDNITKLRDTSADVRSLLMGEKVHGLRLRLPAVEPHITIAAAGPKTTAAAAGIGDRVLGNLLTVEQVGRQRALIDHSGGSGVPLAVWVPLALDPDESDYSKLQAALATYLAAPGYRDMFAAAGFGELVGLARSGTPLPELVGRVPPQLCEMTGAIGDLEAVKARIGAYQDAGADHVALVPTSVGDLGAVAGL